MPLREIELPFFERDRLILSAFERGVASVAHVVSWVICDCARRQIKIHDHDVISRIIILTELGTLSLGGDITRWKRHNTELRIVLDD